MVGDESTHQIPSNGLLFSTFYHFPYTAGPPTSTALMRPSPTITQAFVRSPSTIPYTHCTISPVPCRRLLIWPTDHVVTFSFLSLFSFTWRSLSWPDWSWVIALHDRKIPVDDTMIRLDCNRKCAFRSEPSWVSWLYDESLPWSDKSRSDIGPGRLVSKHSSDVLVD